jgi:hypothetical protein
MKRFPIIPIVFSLLMLAGCQGGNSSSKSSSTTGGVAPTTPATGGTAGGTTPSPATNVTVPEDLKNDAYHWLGLGNSKPMKYSLTANNISMSGEQTITPKTAENGKVLFSVTRTGDLESNLGNEEWSLEKDGVYAVSNTKVTTPVKDLQAPAKMTPGVTWPGKFEAKMDNHGTIENVAQNLTFKIVREESVTTPVGKQQALLVKATGTLKIGSESSRVEASFWYVKDKGMVKNVLKRSSTKDPKAAPTVITIEETK